MEMKYIRKIKYGMHKKSKNKNTIKPDLTVSI